MNLQRGTDAVFAMSLATMMLRATMSGRVGEPGEPGLGTMKPLNLGSGCYLPNTPKLNIIIDVQARLRGTSQAHG